MTRMPLTSSLSMVGLLVLGGGLADACTTGVISGRATVDGRPLLWKNRDAPHKNNQVVHFGDGKYACTAVVNAGQRGSIWMGVNEAGFCIENSVTGDLSEPGAKGPGNGSFMLRALQNCATVAAFEALLRDSNGQRATHANFGVIDAQGGAAIFESSGSDYQKFDANDPDVAPQGYVVRSNFSFTGTSSLDPGNREQVENIYSGERFLRGCQLVELGIADGGVSLNYLLQHSARDYADASGVAIPGSINGAPGELPPQLDTSATISRRTSVSATVFHGVGAGEDPLLTTMWVMLGEPAFTIAVPCWAGSGGVADELAGGKTSPLCDAALALREESYVQSDADDGTSQQRLETSILPELWSRTLPREREYLADAGDALCDWRAEGFDAQQAMKLHCRISRDATQELRQLAESFVPVP